MLAPIVPPQCAVVIQPFVLCSGKGDGGGKTRGQSMIKYWGELAWVSLSGGMWAMIDVIDIHRVERITWWSIAAGKTYYAAGRPDGQSTPKRMHRIILPVHDSVRVDHKDNNGLNNTRFNLRPCTHAENLRNRGRNSNNTSGFKGVHFRKDTKRWTAEIWLLGKKTSLGYFDTAEAAHAAYSVAALDMHGEFARNA